MELVERYVHEVGSRLPSKVRKDVESELRSLLTDSIEERLLENPGIGHEEVVLQVLREFGKPELVAARYNTQPDYLIGPRWYPAFVLTAKVVLIVLAILVALPIGISIMADPERTPEILSLQSLWSAFSNYMGMALANIAAVVVVFAILERIPIRAGVAASEWDPKSLPKRDDPDRISHAGRVARVYLVFGLMVVFTFFPQWFGLIFVSKDSVTVMSPSVFGLQIPALPLQLWWAAVIVLNTILLRRGRWTKGTRWAEFVLGIAGLAIVYMILAQSAKPEITAASLLQFAPQIDRSTAEVLVRPLGILVHIVYMVIALGFFIGLIETGSRFYRLLTRYGYRRSLNGDAAAPVGAA